MRIISAAGLVLTFIAYSAVSNATSERCDRDRPQNCLNGVGPAVINPDNMRMTSSQVSGQTHRQSSEDEDQAYFDTTLTGLAAGDRSGRWSYWLSYNYSDFEGDLPINSRVQPIASYDARLHSVLVGADTLLHDRWVFGLAIGYENTDIDTAYNGGSNQIDGYTVAPYAAFLINDIFNIDAAIGYTDLGYETDRIDNVSGGTIFGEFDARRWFATSSVNALVTHNEWVLGARAGLLYSEEEQDGYTEAGPNTARTIFDRHVDLTQAIFSANVGYSFGRIEPYGYVAYHNDIGRDEGIGPGGLPAGVGGTQPDDDDEIQAALGVRYFGDYLSGTLEWMTVQDRDHFDSNSVLFTIRADL